MRHDRLQRAKELEKEARVDMKPAPAEAPISTTAFLAR
ncbi:hypothetical protein RISK_003010 [Rhodopirellula islandica]|uniref:Uncharacterized protein n=1 Tax=Rhodopirellula islandica TaxID=595434 RepID=A0A0J1BEK9_RHOIS|nr:hypothetical protein RISK_003010 [Rhodopirellula islandica]